MNRPTIAVGVVTFAIAFTIASAAFAARAADESIVAIMRLVPRDAHAAMIVPNLKRSSGNITRLLEGMDRANLLVGSRPIDHFKSLTGYATAVADEGAAAMVVLDANASPPGVAWLIPVTDATNFLEANFADMEGAEADVRRSMDGATLYSRVIASHVALSPSREALDAWTPNVDAPPGDSTSPPHPFLQVAASDAVLVFRNPALEAMQQRLLERAKPFQHLIPQAALRMIDHVESITLSIACDPLALIVRSELRFVDGSSMASKFAENAESPVEVNLLPAKSFALAMSVDLTAFGGRNGLLIARDAINPQSRTLPQWIDVVKSISLGVAPGPNAALLSDAAVVLSSTSPVAIRDGIKAWLSDRDREFSWDESSTLADGTIADALAVRPLDAAPELAARITAESLLFGAGGFRGFMQLKEQSAIVALSQRPALLMEFGKPGERLSDTAAVQIMRQWMPTHRDVEAYIGMAQSATLINNATQALNLPPIALPAFDDNAPPIGIAVDVTRRGFTASTILPAGVLPPMFDEALRRIRSMRDEGAASQP